LNKNDNFKTIGLYFIIFIAILAIIVSNKSNGLMGSAQSENGAQYNYSQLIQDIDDKDISDIKIQRDSEVADAGIAEVTSKDGKKENVYIASISQFMSEISKSVKNGDINVDVAAPSKASSFIALASSILVVIVVITVAIFMFQSSQGMGGKLMNFGKARFKLNSDKNKMTFKNVAGLDEEKAEVEEVVDFLKNPGKFNDIGARIPKGILMVGPPGTGKTLLAKAIAGEAGVPFFSISGSDFVEMYVGVGASRVRDLFEQAKHSTPCLVFIDEIDAVGRKRGAGLGGGHDEREQTLNQLLVEMDGFGVNEGVIVIAATNRPDILDPALLRPGRFDRQIVVGAPDVKGREEILKVHAKGKKFADDVDLHDVAQTTQGFTGADLENLLNEAALHAARENKKVIHQDDIKQSFIRVALGTEKKSKVMTEKERKIVAYHEAGHAILFEKLPQLNPVHTVSIIPVGRAGGYTMPVPKEPGFVFKKAMEEDIVASFGGRVAEEMIFGDYTQGASGDIQHASQHAREMVMRYGMSEELGPILYGDDGHEVFLGNDIGHTRNYSEEVAKKIDAEVKRIIDNAYSEARRILSENEDALHRTAKLLMEKEKVSGDEFRKVMNETEVAEIAEEEFI
jgi:cell division protease FtsH